MMWLLQFCIGLLFANAGEWFMHRYILHYLGKHRDSLWAYHLYEHHYVAYQSDMIDKGYQKLPYLWNTQMKEALTLIIILIVHSPFFWLANGFAWGVYFSIFAYYFLHRQAHLRPYWAKKYLPWHYDHHFVNSNANWCVTYPLFDYLLQTRCKRSENHT